MITSPLQLVEEPKTEEQRDQPCIEQTPSPDAPNLQLREGDESVNNRLSQMELKNKWLKATLQQRTAEQFQRMRSFEEMERQNKVMVNGLQQFQEALHGLQEQSIEADEATSVTTTGGPLFLYTRTPIPELQEIDPYNRYLIHFTIKGRKGEWEMAIEAASKKPFRNLDKGWEKAAQQGDEQVKAEDYIYIIEIQGHEGKRVHSWEMGDSLRRLGLRENGVVQIIPNPSENYDTGGDAEYETGEDHGAQGTLVTRRMTRSMRPT
ncbi:hypothetical protein LTS17_012880 [Exophiala oligosperma]